MQSSILQNESVGFIRCLHCEARGPYIKTTSPEENLEHLTIRAWNGMLQLEDLPRCVDCENDKSIGIL